VRTVYEEEVDGFAFRRKKSKQAPIEAPVPTPVEPEPVVAPIPEPRRKKAPVVAKPVEIVRETRRRSARLSSETESQVDEVSQPLPKTRKTGKPDPPQSPPTFPEVESRTIRGTSKEQQLQVNKVRSKGTTIALPFADTPVIKRNKEMRAAGGRNSSSNRRSSSGLRGRRASSLIDSGTSNGMSDTPPLYELASVASEMAWDAQSLALSMLEFDGMAKSFEQLVEYDGVGRSDIGYK
jgi:kinetochore protein Mis13/DSN1